MKPREIADNLELAQDTLGRWLRFRQYFLMATNDEEISPQDEAEFLETTSSIAANIRKMGQRIDEKQFPFRGKECATLLKAAISISNFVGMNEADRKTFYGDWHKNRVYLARTVGGLKFLQEGYRPPQPKARKKKKANKKLKTVVFLVIAVVVAAGVANYLGLL